MKLYDKEILELYSQLDGLKDIKESDSVLPWEQLKKDEIILKSEQGIELGGKDAVGVSGVAITFDEAILSENTVCVKGNELSGLEGEPDINYARFIVVRLDKKLLDKDVSKLYELIRRIDYLKYHLYPKGFSMRISSVAFKETVRVSKDALLAGISLQRVGELLLQEYLKIDGVAEAKIIFAADTTNRDSFNKIEEIAKKCESITESLNTIYDGLVMDCGSCLQKSLCDEIDGIRALHAASIGKMPIEEGLSI